MIRKNPWKTAALPQNDHKKNTAGRHRPWHRICGRVSAAFLLAAVLLLSGCSGKAAAGSNAAASGTGSTGVSGAEAAAQTATIPDARQLARIIIDHSETVTSAEMDSTVRFHMSLSAGEEEQGFGGEMKSYVRTILAPLTVHMVSTSELSEGISETAQEASPDGAAKAEASPDGATAEEASPDGATEEEASPLNMEVYGELTENGRFATYSKTEDADSWTKTVVDVPESSSDIFDIELLRSIADGETEASVSPATEFVAGKECYVLNTYLSGEHVQRSLETAGSVFSEIGMPLQDLPEDLLKDIQVRNDIWVDLESGLPVKIEQDMAELGNALFSALFESLLSSAQTSGNGSTAAAQEIPVIRFHFSEYSSEIIFRSYNSVPEITIPEEARGAEELSLTPGGGGQ